jgi:hypothetical protein
MYFDKDECDEFLDPYGQNKRKNSLYDRVYKYIMRKE